MTLPILCARVAQLPEEPWPGGLLGTGQPAGDPMPLGIAFALVIGVGTMIAWARWVHQRLERGNRNRRDDSHFSSRLFVRATEDP